MMNLLPFCCLLAVIVAATTAVAAVVPKPSAQRHLNNCVIPLAGPDSVVQREFEQACTVDLNGADNCIVTIPAYVLQYYNTACQLARGKYLGLIDASYNCFAPTVCNPLAGSLCFTYDETLCLIDPSCMFTGTGCTANSYGGCWPVTFDFVWTEKPKCIDSSCDCESTAVDIVDEEMNDLKADVAVAYAQFDSAVWTCTNDLGSYTCGGEDDIDDDDDDSGALDKLNGVTVLVVTILNIVGSA